MTAHVSFISAPYALVVGDRLLTVDNNGFFEHWDESSNKTVIVFARNASFVLSFAGLAHIAKIPTDEWLVDTITKRVKPARYRGHLPLLEGGPERPELTLGLIRQRIVEGVRADFARLSRTQTKNGLEIMLTGWTWKRRARGGRIHATSFVNFITDTTVKTERGYDEYKKIRAAMHGRRDQLVKAAIGAKVWPLRNLDALIGSGDFVTEDQIEDAIVADILTSAKRPNSTVGREYVSIFLPSIEYAPSVKFIRDPAQLPNGTSYWPAIVHWKAGIVNPSVASNVLAGTWMMGVRFIVEPPSPLISGVHSLSGQPRRPLSL